jgi:hypothetical protein
MLSERQLYRSMSRYEELGDAGLVHQLRDALSNRKHGLKKRKLVIRLYREKYSDYGPTLFTEELQKRHGITLGVETARQWLIKAELWQV